MMKDEYVLAYDIGTSGVKIALVDKEGGIINSETVNYSLIVPLKGRAEQNPDEIWHAVCLGTKLTIKNKNVDPKKIKGIAFDTQWKGIIPLNSENEVLHNAIIWLDGRAVTQAKTLNALMNTEMFTGRDYHAKLMWVKEELPDIYEKTECFLEVNSYLKFKLTGEKAVDLSNDFIHGPDSELNGFYNKVIETAGLDKDKFPPQVMPSDKVGEVNEKAAEETGLIKGIPVFGGCGDIPAIAVGAGCSTMGNAHIYLGSSGWLGISVPKRKEGIGELYQSFDKGKELLLYVMQTACMAQNWACDQFYRVEKSILKDDIFDFIDKDIADIPPGSVNLIATPWLHGELPPLSDEARMVFFNLSNMHDRRHMINAVREGICFSLRWKIEVYKEQTGIKLDSIRVVGGAASSEIWMQSLSDILKIPVIIPENARHAGAIGAAFCALVGLGEVKDFNTADKVIKIKRTFYPNPVNEKLYDKLFSVFKNIYPSMKDMFSILN